MFLSIAGSIVALAAFSGAVFHYKTRQLVSVALCRKLPRGMKEASGKISGTANNLCMKEIDCAGNKLLKANCKTIIIKAKDGKNLVGHLRESKNPKRIIIAMHGWRSSWYKDFGVIADFWLKNDCTVLYAEQRGQNNSDGEYMGFGLLERYDCIDWANYISESLGRNVPLYLAGISMGASTVLMATGSTLPSNVCGVIADCGFTSPHNIWKHIAENNLNISFSLMGRLANNMCRKRINAGSMEYSTLDALKNNKIPVLFVHGSGDKFVPARMTFENYKACTAPKRLFIVPDAGHCMSYLTDKEGYEKTTKMFWKECELL